MSAPPEVPEGRATWNQLLVCERCGGPLVAPGALLFSPPMGDNTVRKHHICAPCYDVSGSWLAAPEVPEGAPWIDVSVSRNGALDEARFAVVRPGAGVEPGVVFASAHRSYLDDGSKFNDDCDRFERDVRRMAEITGYRVEWREQDL